MALLSLGKWYMVGPWLELCQLHVGLVTPIQIRKHLFFFFNFGHPLSSDIYTSKITGDPPGRPVLFSITVPNSKL